MIKRSEPILAVADIPAAVRYYREVLGFESQWLWGEPPTFGAVQWGKTQVMFSLQPQLQENMERHQHFFSVEDVQGLYERHKAAGAAIVEDIGNKPWGVREYTVRDLNGYHLRFAGSLTYERLPTATESLPAHIGIEIRLPTMEEYEKLITAVGWSKNPKTMAEALRRSMFFVLAIDTRDGKAVGITRVCGDGRAYTIWDVVVMPTYQGQKIGSALVEAALSELRKVGERGAFIGLFTHRPKFYERLGFEDDHGMHVML